MDVHSVRVGEPSRQTVELNGGGLDRGSGPGILLVLRGLRSAAHLRRHSLAGNS